MKLIWNPLVLLAITLTILSAFVAGVVLNTPALFLPDYGYKVEAVIAVWLSVLAVATLMFISGGHGKSLFRNSEHPACTRRVMTGHQLSRDIGGPRNHRTFGATSGGHIAQLASAFQRMVGHTAGGRPQLMQGGANG